MAEMTIVQGDDWVGVYVDNKLVSEDHDLDAFEVVGTVFQYNVTECEKKFADLDWLADQGSLPELLEDVQFEE
jgi:hypothetical protein